MVLPVLKQLWTVSAVFLNMCAQGMVLSYPSCLLPGLRTPDSNIQPDMNTASWLSSCIGLASLPGYITSSYLMSRFGRKLTHGLVMIPGAIGCILISQSTNITMLMIGRILGGITGGATIALGAIVVGEYSSPENRGMFLNLKTASLCLGSMMVHIFGTFMHWKAVALITLVPHVMSILIILTWPESPAWLASRKEFEKCKVSFFWLRGKNQNSVKELDQMIQAQMSLVNEDSRLIDDVKEFSRKFTKMDFLKPMAIITVGTVLLEASGRHIFPAYALDIIGEVARDKSNSFYYTLAIDIIITASCTSSSVLVKMFRRRTLLLSTGLASVAVVGTLCGYLFLISRDVITEAHPAIPLGLFVIYFILVNLGCTPIPIAFMGELLPLCHRGVGSMLAGLIMSMILYIALQITPYLLVTVKVYGTFTVFGVATFMCLLILYYILPETKDRTLQEIEDNFNFGKFREEADEEVKCKMLSKNHKLEC